MLPQSSIHQEASYRCSTCMRAACTSCCAGTWTQSTLAVITRRLRCAQSKLSCTVVARPANAFVTTQYPPELGLYWAVLFSDKGSSSGIVVQHSVHVVCRNFILDQMTARSLLGERQDEQLKNLTKRMTSIKICGVIDLIYTGKSDIYFCYVANKNC